MLSAAELEAEPHAKLTRTCKGSLPGNVWEWWLEYRSVAFGNEDGWPTYAQAGKGACHGSPP